MIFSELKSSQEQRTKDGAEIKRIRNTSLLKIVTIIYVEANHVYFHFFKYNFYFKKSFGFLHVKAHYPLYN